MLQITKETANVSEYKIGNNDWESFSVVGCSSWKEKKNMG